MSLSHFRSLCSYHVRKLKKYRKLKRLQVAWCSYHISLKSVSCFKSYSDKKVKVMLSLHSSFLLNYVLIRLKNTDLHTLGERFGFFNRSCVKLKRHIVSTLSCHVIWKQWMREARPSSTVPSSSGCWTTKSGPVRPSALGSSEIKSLRLYMNAWYAITANSWNKGNEAVQWDDKLINITHPLQQWNFSLSILTYWVSVNYMRSLITHTLDVILSGWFNHGGWARQGMQHAWDVKNS